MAGGSVSTQSGRARPGGAAAEGRAPCVCVCVWVGGAAVPQGRSLCVRGDRGGRPRRAPGSGTLWLRAAVGRSCGAGPRSRRQGRLCSPRPPALPAVGRMRPVGGRQGWERPVPSSPRVGERGVSPPSGRAARSGDIPLGKEPKGSGTCRELCSSSLQGDEGGQARRRAASPSLFP